MYINILENGTQNKKKMYKHILIRLYFFGVISKYLKCTFYVVTHTAICNIYIYKY